MKNAPLKDFDSPPTIRLDEDDLPAMKDWSVGKEYTLTLKVKMVSMRHGDEYAEMDGGKPDTTVSGSFKVLEVTSPDSKTSITRADKLKAISDKAKS